MRYRLMAKSTQKNSLYDSPYYDVLSANYSQLRDIPGGVQYELTKIDILRLDLLISKLYGNMKYLDIILMINNIAHRSHLKSGQILYFPPKYSLDEKLREARK